MGQKTIDIGTAPNNGTGDPLRTAFDKSNANFTELYAIVAALQAAGVFEYCVRRATAESADGTSGQVITYSSTLVNAGQPIIDDYEGLGIELVAYDEDGFTINSLTAGNFGYLTTIEV